MTNQNKQPPLIIWWVLWGAMLCGVCAIYFTMSHSVSANEKASMNSAFWMVAMIPFVISSILRWLVLTQIKTGQTALPFFIVGMALAESTCMMGLFVFSAHSTALFALSVLGIAQYVPYFAGSFPEHKG